MDYIKLRIANGGISILSEKPTQHPLKVTINGNKITSVLIGRHYLKKHAADVNDLLILELVMELNGIHFLLILQPMILSITSLTFSSNQQAKFIESFGCLRERILKSLVS